jgi:hypothetical protein
MLLLLLLVLDRMDVTSTLSPKRGDPAARDNGRDAGDISDGIVALAVGDVAGSNSGVGREPVAPAAVEPEVKEGENIPE